MIVSMHDEGLLFLLVHLYSEHFARAFASEEVLDLLTALFFFCFFVFVLFFNHVFSFVKDIHCWDLIVRWISLCL